MKKLLSAIVFVLCTTILFAQEKLPNRETTVNYVKKIFNEANGFEYKFKDNTTYKVQGKCLYQINYSCLLMVEYSIKIGDNLTDYSYILDTEDSQKMSYGKAYRKIDWAKMVKIGDATGIENSPVNFLVIDFIENSVLLREYKQEYYNLDKGYNGVTEIPDKSVSSIFFPYKNEPGVKERLIKALNHLSSLDKQARAKNDPFGS